MKRLRVLVVLALLGLAVAIVAVVDSNRPPVVTATDAPAPAAPFAAFVAGAGITEIGRGNVAVATNLAGVVTEVYVKAGDLVAAGAPLFKIDDRDLQARLAVEQARIGEAQAALDTSQHKLGYVAHLERLDHGVVSRQALGELRDDVAAAASAVDSARAVAGQTRAQIERSVVRAPSAGRILQIGIRAGEYAASAAAAPLLLMGDDSRMYVRVDVDENDAWRIRPEAPAVAVVRGNPALRTPLRFEYIEPYVTAKTSLTGQSTERSDVRVLQVVYSFDRAAAPVYVGQQMDVYIETAATGRPAVGDAR